jgi:hypothetical protein
MELWYDAQRDDTDALGWRICPRETPPHSTVQAVLSQLPITMSVRWLAGDEVIIDCIKRNLNEQQWMNGVRYAVCCLDDDVLKALPDPDGTRQITLPSP